MIKKLIGVWNVYLRMITASADLNEQVDFTLDDIFRSDVLDLDASCFRVFNFSDLYVLVFYVYFVEYLPLKMAGTASNELLKFSLPFAPHVDCLQQPS